MLLTDEDDARMPSPPPKRRCTRNTGINYIQESSTGQQQNNTQFWFIDGDFILEVEEQLFRIHSNIMQQSDIFGDMLALPQPQNGECIDGCPTVKLADSAKDWVVALKWLYDPKNLVRHPLTFDTLSGALRISTKYEIAGLREWCVDELRSRWPSVLENMGLNALPHAAEAISLARECDVPEILPAAFYALSVQKWSCSADGGRSHLVLHTSDIRRLIAGRERLQDILIQYISDPLYSEYKDAVVCNVCRPLIERFWRTKLAPNASSPWGCWLLRELHNMTLEQQNSQHYATWCADCAFQHHCIAWDRMRSLRDAIPRLFMLV